MYDFSKTTNSIEKTANKNHFCFIKNNWGQMSFSSYGFKLKIKRNYENNDKSMILRYKLI